MMRRRQHDARTSQVSWVSAGRCGRGTRPCGRQTRSTSICLGSSPDAIAVLRVRLQVKDLVFDGTASCPVVRSVVRDAGIVTTFNIEIDASLGRSVVPAEAYRCRGNRNRALMICGPRRIARRCADRRQEDCPQDGSGRSSNPSEALTNLAHIRPRSRVRSSLTV